MSRQLITIVLLVSILMPHCPLFADVIITRDDMILNGKILEDKKPVYVKFANYHGNFTIKYKQIKEIHRTDSFKEDIKVLQQLGKTVNEDEIKNNYQSGERKLKEQNKNFPVYSEGAESFVLMLEIFSSKNLGKINSVLPSSRGLSLSGEIPFGQNSVFKKFYIYGIDCEADYLYSENDARFIKGFSGSAGPLWRVPVDNHFNFNISAAAGAGWYSVKNDAEKAEGVKWNLVLRAGPALDFNSIIISPQIRIDYIYDGYAPLLGVGLSLGAGYKF